MLREHQAIPSARKTFWAAAAFYFLIGFEFIYMATPFAMYFYSVYRPGLDLVGGHPALAWLSGFFLPHFVIDTTSDLLNVRNEIGIVFAAAGFVLFFVGAAQVYYHKLTRKGAVTGGVYNAIRHPQYASLMLCSLGLLILWPRYLVLLSFVAMMLVYYFLAKLEEKECELKFGESYAEYKQRTGMFLPFRFPETERLRLLPANGVRRVAAIVGLYVTVSAIAVACAYFVKGWSLGKIYAAYEKDGAYVSITRVGEDSLNAIVRTALADKKVRELLSSSDDSASAKYVGYVLPAGYYALEIPMVREDSVERFHFIKARYDRSTCRVIITKAVGIGSNATGKDILLRAVRRIPVAEAWLDLRNWRVTRVASLAGESGIVRMPGPMF